ncbi:MAG TPA: hypothetical protein VMJ52_04125 [Xanthobacteraceae bacterium]|nr:hypothetical protein [Xanthobacteraceae bacterium]
MAKMIQTTGASFTRIFARLARTHQTPNPGQERHWYDCDVCSRGL